MSSFTISRLPRIIFRRGAIADLPDLIANYGSANDGSRVLLVTGRNSFTASHHFAELQSALAGRATLCIEHVVGEPSPELVDEMVCRHAGGQIDVVVGIGGGSALDCAKAVAGLLRVNRSVLEFLEGVGPQHPYPGPATPLIAVPTTAGTGSEVTKNSVLSRNGANGFKKSFRDDQLIAEVALLDPQLLATCPPDLIAADGMDALTQLIEAFVSRNATLPTDALIRSALPPMASALMAWQTLGADATEAQEAMLYGSLVSGIALAQCGLGAVHGIAPPLGALHGMAHGVACGTLLAEVCRMNIKALLARDPASEALGKYAEVASLLCGHPFADLAAALGALLARLDDLTERLALPRLHVYGITEADLPAIVAQSRGNSMRTNPALLNDDEVMQILRARL